MRSSKKTFFERVPAKHRREGGIDPVPLPDGLTPRLLAKFYTLPLDRKERCLANLGEVIRDAEALDCGMSAAALQRVYDDWYKTIAQEQADRAFQGEIKD